MAALQCDHASEAERVAARLRARRVLPAAGRILAALGGAFLLILGVLLLELFGGTFASALTGLLEGALVVSLVLVPLALVVQRGQRRRALAALAELTRSAPLCSFDSPSDGFTFFTKAGFFREDPLSYVDYYGDHLRLSEVRYDAATRRLALLGSEPGYRGQWTPTVVEIELPAGVPAAITHETVALLATAVRARRGL